MRGAKLLAAVVIFALSLGCQRREQTHEETALVNAYKLIDAQRTDEAIGLLENELSRLDPNGPYFVSYKVALGSAYAHKAGIRVQKFAKLLRVGKIDTKFKEKIKVERGKKIGKAESVDNFLKSVVRMFTAIGKMTGVYTVIPTIKPEDERYVVYALKILDSLPEGRLQQGDALYRAVIRIIYLKHYMATRILDDGLPVETDVKRCEINFDKITETLHKLTLTGVSILNDLALAQPKKAKGYLESRENLTRSAADLTIISTFASLVDDATMMMSKEALVETGMRKLLKCSAQTPDQAATSPSGAAL